MTVADQAELERVIVDAAHRLDRQQVRHDRFGIQFVQIGTDPAAAELLHTLDDHLVSRYKIRVRYSLYCTRDDRSALDRISLTVHPMTLRRACSTRNT